MRLSAAAKTLLTNVNNATLQGVSLFIDMKSKEAKSLHTAKLIDINEALTNEAGHIAARTNDAGKEAVSKQTEGGQRAAPVRVPVPENGFEIITDAPEPPPSRRGQGRASPYPFDKLGMGQAFFIPATEEVSDPAKKFASTVSSANKRFGKNENDPRKFRIFAGERNGQPGAYVKRVPITTPDAA